MKTSAVLIVIITGLSLVSCKKKGDDDLPPVEPEINYHSKFLVKRIEYSIGGTTLRSESYTLWGIDSANPNIIYAISDSTKPLYQSWHYDANGRLVKIVYNNNYRQPVTVPAKDSVLISRPGANTIQWVYSPAINTPVQTATITDLGSSRKLVMFTQAGDDPTVYYEKLYYNTMGSLDSNISVSRSTFFGGGGEVYGFKRELFYNSDHAPVNQVVTTSQSFSPFTMVSTSAMTRDNHENAYLHAFMDKLCGSDMTWLSYSAFRAQSWIFGTEFTDRVMLLNGTLLTMSSNLKKYNNGVFVSDEGTVDSEHSLQYDIQGRLLSSEPETGGQLSKRIEVQYFD